MEWKERRNEEMGCEYVRREGKDEKMQGRREGGKRNKEDVLFLISDQATSGLKLKWLAERRRMA